MTAPTVGPDRDRDAAEEDAPETHPSVYDLTDADLIAAVRYHGANAVIDALLYAAGEAYEEEAVAKVHEFVDRRARVTAPGSSAS